MKQIFLLIFLLTIKISFSQSKKEQIQILTNQVDSLNKVASSQSKTINDKNSQISGLNTKTTSLESNISALNDNVSKLSTELQIFKTESKTKQHELNAKNTEISDLQQQIKFKTDSLDSLRAELEKLKLIQKPLVTNFELYLSKKKTLNGLIGEYKLTHIDAFTGANNMMDYSIQKGEWVASGSSNSGGMRENHDIDLSKDELASLQTMKIVVADDLSVTLFCNNKAYFKAPFQEDGMTYLLKNSPKDLNMEEDLTKTTVFIGEYLYLYAKDNLSENEINSLNIAYVGGDVVVIKYNINSEYFEMTLFNGGYYDTSTYVFH